MHLKTAFTRAARAMREDAKLHLVTLSSLTVAFLCLATALCAIGWRRWGSWSGPSSSPWNRRATRTDR